MNKLDSTSPKLQTFNNKTWDFAKYHKHTYTDTVSILVNTYSQPEIILWQVTLLSQHEVWNGTEVSGDGISCRDKTRLRFYILRRPRLIVDVRKRLIILLLGVICYTIIILISAPHVYFILLYCYDWNHLSWIIQ